VPALQRLIQEKRISPAVDSLASFITTPAPSCICGIQMLQRADGSATFAAVFGVQEHVEEELALRIASECDTEPNRAGLQWVAVESLADAFERQSVNNLRQLRVMPRSVLVHSMGHYPQLPPINAAP